MHLRDRDLTGHAEELTQPLCDPPNQRQVSVGLRQKGGHLLMLQDDVKSPLDFTRGRRKSAQR